MSEKEFLTSKDVAELLGISPSTVRRLADKGELPSFRTSPRGGHRRFSKQIVLAYLDKRAIDDSITF